MVEERENLVEQFSTFLDFQQGGKQLVCCWRSPYNLLTNHIEWMAKNYPQGDGEFWAKYWLRGCLVCGDGMRAIAINQPSKQTDGFFYFLIFAYFLAKSHFSAYLEEVCYSTAFYLAKDFNWHGIEKQELFGEFFLIARKIAASPEKTFRSYNLGHPKCSKVTAWAELKIKAAIREYLIEQNLMRVVDKYSDWGLLRNFSKKQIKECLQHRGLVGLDIKRCLLALQTFLEIYVPKKPKGKLLPPTDKEWKGIFERFARLSDRHNLPPAANRQEVENLLKTCVDALRAPDSPICQKSEEKIEPKNREVFQLLNPILAPAYEKLPPESQLMLKLWYGLRLNQKDIGKVFGIKQHTVSRYKDKQKQPLFFALLQWLKLQKRAEDLTEEESGKMEEMLDEWLRDYSWQFFSEILQSLMLKIDPDDANWLSRRYGKGKLTATKAIARQFKTSDYEVKKALKRAETDLENSFKAWLETLLDFPVASLGSSDRRVKKLVASWLRRSP